MRIFLSWKPLEVSTELDSFSTAPFHWCGERALPWVKAAVRSGQEVSAGVGGVGLGLSGAVAERGDKGWDWQSAAKVELSGLDASVRRSQGGV